MRIEPKNKDAPRILSCGEVLWDVFPEGARFGGAPANLACHAALLGASVTLLSAVGCDASGKAALDILRGFRVDTSLIQQIPGSPTGSVGVSLDGAGKPKYQIHPDAAWDRIARTESLDACVQGVDAVCFGTLGQRGETSRATIREVLRLAKELGLLRVLDINLRRPFYDAALLRESIALVNVLKLSDEELPETAAACGVAREECEETVLRSLLSRCGLELVVMTLGERGALLVSAEEAVRQPGIPTTVVDTVGAGDSFTAAFVLGLLRGEARPVALRKACETASAVCARAGAVPEIPRTV
jgi:fructokinase